MKLRYIAGAAGAAAGVVVFASAAAGHATVATAAAVVEVGCCGLLTVPPSKPTFKEES